MSSTTHPSAAERLPSELETALEYFLDACKNLENSLAVLPAGDLNPGYYGLLEKALGPLPTLHDAYDRYVASVLKAEGKNITCKKGCSACCRHFVTSVEPFEILALHLRIRKSERYPDQLFACHSRVTRFDQILKKEGEDPEAEDRALYRYFLRGAACPFLEKNGECGIYESRPMSCRMFFAESPPRFCSGKNVVSPWNKNFQVELPDEAEEALARCSALLDNLELPAGLFSGVLEANALLGKYEG